MDGLIALTSFAGFDFSRIANFTSLLVLPFADEDIAIVTGAYYAVNGVLPVGLVAGAIYGGMVASDFALYGIGAGARSLPWLSRYAVNERVRELSDAVKRNVLESVALYRVMPGAASAAVVACGWARVPLARFAAVSLGVSALYLAITLYLVMMFGAALDDRAGLWAWPLLFVALFVVRFARRRIFAYEKGEPAPAAEPAQAKAVPLRLSRKLLSLW
jgi:membrane protein DedA with SNARE-associated domain